jgi:hypothetical protein
MTVRPELPRARMSVVVVVTSVLALAGLGALEWYAFTRGNALQRDHPEVKLGAGPFVGSWDLRVTALVLPAVAIAAAAVWALPALARRLVPWRAIAATATIAAVFALALAATDGWSAVLKPVTHPTEYWSGVAKAGPAGEYLRTFLARQKFASVHVRGHPPGFVLLLIGLRELSLGAAWVAGALSFLGVAMTVGAVGFTVWRISGAEALQRSLPFLALAPYAVWQGTSADAFFTGVTSAGIALLVAGMTATRTRTMILTGGAGGMVLGWACFLTFGTPTLVPLVVALVCITRRFRWIIPAAIGFAAVFAVFAGYHYWWLDGLDNTRRFYREGTAKFRPAFYFFFANVAVFAIAIGPAALAGITRLRHSRVVAIVAGGLACMLLADASGLSKAETERIWLLYMPWVSVAAGTLATTLWRQRAWLTAQAAAAVGLQILLVSKW